MSREGYILPVPDVDSAPFWEGCAAGELRMQACTACGRLRFPPRPMCPHCRSTERTWKAMSGRGSIWSYVVTHPPLLPAYQALAPYNVILVALDEDPIIRLTGNLVSSERGEINEIDPATIEIGAPVRVVFKQMSGEISFPLWVRL
jgi:uncharacterized OB-fold protein